MQIHFSTSSVILKWQPQSTHAHSKVSTAPTDLYSEVIIVHACAFRSTLLGCQVTWMSYKVFSLCKQLLAFFRTELNMYLHTCTHTYALAHTQTHMHAQTCAHAICTYIHVCIHNTGTQAYSHTIIYERAHMHTHVHTHTPFKSLRRDVWLLLPYAQRTIPVRLFFYWPFLPF